MDNFLTTSRRLLASTAACTLLLLAAPKSAHAGPFAAVATAWKSLTGADETAFALHLVPGAGTHGVGMPKVTGFSYGYLGTVNHSVVGVDVGLFTYTSTSLHGVQLAQVFSWVGDDVHGGQLAGALNVAAAVRGVQAAGAVNVAGKVHGGQAAGAVNVAGNVRGVQAAGAVNVAKRVRGVQAAGAVNVAGKVQGVQAGTVNVLGKLSGLQVGVINVVGHIKRGDSFGLFTFAGNGYNHLQISKAGDDGGELALTFGGKRLYTVLSLGATGQERLGREGEPAWRGFIGWGWHQRLGRRWYVDADLSAGAEQGERRRLADGCTCEEVRMLSRARLLMGWAPFRRFALFSGVSMTAVVARAQVHSGGGRRDDVDWTWSGGGRSAFVPQAVVGIRL